LSIEELINQRQKDFLSAGAEGDSSSKEYVDKKMQVYQRVRQRISENRDLFLTHGSQDLQYIRNNIWKIIEDEQESNRSEWILTSYERAEILEQLMHTMFGYGIIEPLINDRSITEIMVNGINKIYIEKDGQLQLAKDRRGAPLKFRSNDELFQVIEKIVAPINRKIDESDPIVDARLPNGSRVNVVLSPISLDGPALTIRKFPEKPYTMHELVKFGMCSAEVAKFLERLVKARFNIIISGGTGSGKTTFLNALSMFIPAESRIVTTEDAAELKLSHAENIIRLETRPPNIEGKGAIHIRELVRSSLRMRPDRIIVGEVRAGEALDMLQAMNTGHEGSLSTIHANSAKDMVSRLETMVLMAGLELPIPAVRQQIASAVEIVVQLSKGSGGKRRVIEIGEVIGMDKEQVVIQSLFHWEEKEGLIQTNNEFKALHKLERR
jgi:pilus assembly protein CpaF